MIERVLRARRDVDAPLFALLRSSGDPAVVAPVVETLADLAGQGRALEFGVGTGRIALPLVARGVRVFGIDASEAMVARLRAKTGGEDIDVTIGDFALEVQMDKLARLVGKDPIEFRMINAYRDGDMKAHRREAKNTALIECVQVAAEKAKWPLRDQFKRASSRKDGGGSRAVIPPTPRDADAQRAAALQQRTTYDRAPAAAVREAPPASQPSPPPPPRPQAPSHGAARFSSVFGTRRR